MNYYSFNTYLRERFGEKVRKIGLNAGFTCPNSDGTSSRDGCIFCNESAFSEFAGTAMSIREQIESSIKSFKEKKDVNKYIAYFQNATNTNARLEDLKAVYDVIKEYTDIVALFISTRPDCVNDEKLDLIAGYAGDHDVWVEYGVQTIHDRTLELINRKHTYADSVDAIKKTADRGIKTAAHIILGLPGETEEDMMKTAEEISKLPISGVKLHMFHVLIDTKVERMYGQGKVKLLQKYEYVNIVCSFLEKLKENCVVLRLVSDARKEFLVAPDWIAYKIPVIVDINREFIRRGTRQGSAVQ